jgi:hypothetical protein
MKVTERATTVATCDICGATMTLPIISQKFVKDDEGLAFMMRVEGLDLELHLAMHEECTCMWHSGRRVFGDPKCPVHPS